MYDYDERHLSGTDLDYLYNDDGPLYTKGKSTPSHFNPFSCPKDFTDMIVAIIIIVSLIVAWPITGPLLLVCGFISYFVS